MKELGLLLLIAPFALLVVLRNELQTAQVQVAQPTQTTVRQPVILPTPVIAPTVAPKQISAGPIGDILAVAQQWLGVRYQWGGCTMRGVDCSCFVMNVLKVFGIQAPRTTKPQFAWGTPVSRDSIRLGDLVFFNNTCSDCGQNPTHVGLAISNMTMIHCGDPCQVASIGSFREYAGARRPPW